MTTRSTKRKIRNVTRSLWTRQVVFASLVILLIGSTQQLTNGIIHTDSPAELSAVSNVTGASSTLGHDQSGGFQSEPQQLDHGVSDFDLAQVRTGEQRFAVIAVRYYNQPTTRFTIAEIEDMMDTLNDFWFNISYGMISIYSQVVGWYDLGPDTIMPVAIIEDAIAAADDVIDFTQFDFVLVWVNGDWGGISSIGSIFSIQTNDQVDPFNVGASIVCEMDPVDYPVPKVWGIAAHEMGHSFGLYHTHLDYNSDYSLMANGIPSDLNVYSQSIEPATGWFDTSLNQEIVHSGDDGMFYLRSRSADVSGQLQSLKIEISSDKYYLVEAVKQWSEDAWVADEGVLIYMVGGPFEHPNDDYHSPTDTLWQVGEIFYDNFHHIFINVTSIGEDGFSMYVSNNVGVPDPKITKWGSPEGSPPPYESPDIWVDSFANGYYVYRHTDNGQPIGNGDEPWANHENRLYARIHNVGDANAYDVTVRFYFRHPISAGNPNWDLIGEALLEIVPARGYNVAMVPWTPEIEVSPGESGLVAVHGCIRVVIEPYPGEATGLNNMAQENIVHFEVTAENGAPLAQTMTTFQPTTLSFQIGNPFNVSSNIYVNVVDISLGWTLDSPTGVIGFHNFTALETKDFSLSFTPAQDVDYGDTLNVSVIAAYIETGEDSGDALIECSYLRPFAGLTLWTRALYNSTISLGAEASYNSIIVTGSLSTIDGPPSNLFPRGNQDRNLLIELVSEGTGNTTYEIVNMNDNGAFSHTFTNLSFG